MIKLKKPSDVAPSEITPKALYHERRRFLAASAIAAIAPLLPAGNAMAAAKLRGVVKSRYVVNEELTPYSSVTSYNNFYEFGTDKEDPARTSRAFQPKPWKIAVEGEVEKPGVYDFDDLIRPHKLEERIYRLRCVEAWSMVIPWVGIPLGDVIKRFGPTSRAKYVLFETLHDPERMPGQHTDSIKWPYVEGLRIDEAVHPLTLLAVGLYGEELPNQNGAPIRLVVPWKYGYKSIKSIVKIRFQEKQPITSWNSASSAEYGFYANVNPAVSHPRWSQRRERRIGEILKRDTLMFNGYANEVARLYAKMDLTRYF